MSEPSKKEISTHAIAPVDGGYRKMLAGGQARGDETAPAAGWLPGVEER